MEKTYKSESREIKKIALASRLTFRQRKLFLDIQPYITALFFMIMCGVIVKVEVQDGYPIIAWIVLCFFSAPLYLIIMILFNCIPRFKTLEEHIEYSLNKYLEIHSWRNICVLLKKHKFPIIIENALFNILLKKINRMSKKLEIIETIEKDGVLLFDEETKKIRRI